MPLFNLWLEDKGMNGAYIGYIASIPWIVMLIVQPLWGLLADRSGKLKCFKISIIFSAFIFIILPFVSFGKISIALMTLLFAIFQTPVLPLLDSLTLDHTTGNSSVSYSSLRFWGAPGFASGAFLTGFLIPYFSSGIVFTLSGIFLVITFFVAQSFEHSKKNFQEPDIQFSQIREALKSRNLIMFLFVIMLASVAQSASSFYLSVYMREIGASSTITGAAIGVQGLSELPFYFIAAWLLRKTSALNIVMISIFGTAIRLFLYYINHQPFLVIGIETLNGVTWTLLWIASVEFVNEQVPSSWRSTGQSLLWAMYFGAGAVIGNISIGNLYQIMPMKLVFGLSSLMILIVGVFCLFMFPKSLKRVLNYSKI